MLSAQENALLTQVGPGTPINALFRRFWLPVLPRNVGRMEDAGHLLRAI